MICALAAVATWAAAQHPPTAPAAIPVLRLAPPEATTTELLGSVQGLVQFAGGGVVVNDAVKRRLGLFDPTLQKFTVTADSAGTGATLYPAFSLANNLYAYLGDTAAFSDMATSGFILLGPNGKFGRAVAHPRPRDLMAVNQQYSGLPAFDARGRFIYRAFSQGARPPLSVPGAPPPVRTRDTSAIVRADFDTRTIDTITQIVLPALRRTIVVRDAQDRPSAKATINPVPFPPDEWAVLSDGSLAIVRQHDYHIDWMYADGTSASTPKMPFDWRRLTDADKQAKIDSARRMIDSVNATDKPYDRIFERRAGHAKTDTVIPTIEFVPLSEMEDYVPPVRAGSLMADRDNHLWILPSTTLSATGGGLLYDVVNKQGEIFERVQLPPGRALAGFGPGGTVYLKNGDRTKGYVIERTRVVGARNGQ